MTYTMLRHPKSGDVYAVEHNEAGTIIRAVGPLHYSDLSETDAHDMITNASNDSDARDDGDWLQAEITKYA